MGRFFSALLITGIMLLSTSVLACDIYLYPDKEKYKVGETAVIRMEVKWTHKTCIKEAEEPKLNLEGLELKAKTKYKEKSPGLWEIKYKMTVKAASAVVNAVEDCSKGGGTATLKLEVAE